MPVQLGEADEAAIQSKIESITTFLSETETLSDGDIKDMVSDILAMISLIVFGTETP